MHRGAMNRAPTVPSLVRERGDYALTGGRLEGAARAPEQEEDPTFGQRRQDVRDVGRAEAAAASVVSGPRSAAKREPPAKVLGDLFHRGPAHPLVAADILDEALKHQQHLGAPA